MVDITPNPLARKTDWVVDAIVKAIEQNDTAHYAQAVSVFRDEATNIAINEDAQFRQMMSEKLVDRIGKTPELQKALQSDAIKQFMKENFSGQEGLYDLVANAADTHFKNVAEALKTAPVIHDISASTANTNVTGESAPVAETPVEQGSHPASIPVTTDELIANHKAAATRFTTAKNELSGDFKQVLKDAQTLQGNEREAVVAFAEQLSAGNDVVRTAELSQKAFAAAGGAEKVSFKFKKVIADLEEFPTNAKGFAQLSDALKAHTEMEAIAAGLPEEARGTVTDMKGKVTKGAKDTMSWVRRTSASALHGIAEHQNIAIVVPAAITAAALAIPNKDRATVEADGTSASAETEKVMGGGKKLALIGGTVATVGAVLNKWGPGSAQGWVASLAKKVGGEAARAI